jgi:gliding motility-associated-like protein
VGPDDNSDGIAFVNLHKVSQDPDLQFAFYESPEDRDTNRPIINSENYQNTQAFSQLIYYKVTNGKGCSNQGEFSLIITPATVEASPLSPVYACDIDPADLEMTGNFDLQTLVEGAYDSGLTVDLYASLEDAALQVNEIVESILTSGPSDVYLRLSDGGICLGIEALALSVNPSPSPQMEDTYVLCADQGSTVLVGPPGFDAYRWIKKTTHGSTVAGEGREVRIFEPGNYELEASYIYTAVSGGFQCSNSVEFQVTPSGKASISDIEILDFSENNSVDISVDGTGVYEFSLDGLTYQETPKFTGIPPGFYTLFVRDREGCGTVTEDIAVMGYPKFFTPNGDGFNDYWQLSGTNQLFEPEAFIGIYDRFGSFITQVSVQDRGWNGMANSRMMPAADYWFRITLSNGREIKGHFALKR